MARGIKDRTNPPLHLPHKYPLGRRRGDGWEEHYPFSTHDIFTGDDTSITVLPGVYAGHTVRPEENGTVFTVDSADGWQQDDMVQFQSVEGVSGCYIKSATGVNLGGGTTFEWWLVQHSNLIGGMKWDAWNERFDIFNMIRKT